MPKYLMPNLGHWNVPGWNAEAGQNAVNARASDLDQFNPITWKLREVVNSFKKTRNRPTGVRDK